MDNTLNPFLHNYLLTQASKQFTTATTACELRQTLHFQLLSDYLYSIVKNLLAPNTKKILEKTNEIEKILTYSKDNYLKYYYLKLNPVIDNVVFTINVEYGGGLVGTINLTIN